MGMREVVMKEGRTLCVQYRMPSDAFVAIYIDFTEHSFNEVGRFQDGHFTGVKNGARIKKKVTVRCDSDDWLYVSDIKRKLRWHLFYNAASNVLELINSYQML